jgi:cbb3-type cytochrome oxidase subunit 1
MQPFYWTRLVGGLIYVTGVYIMAFNVAMTIFTVPEKSETPQPSPAK